MNWVTQSFQEHTVAWLVVSSVVGGIIATAIRFLFEDVFRPAIGWRRLPSSIMTRVGGLHKCLGTSVKRIASPVQCIKMF
jgi:hypothetical protein